MVEIDKLKDVLQAKQFSCKYKNKVSKGAKIRNRYNQAPHLTQDTNIKTTLEYNMRKREYGECQRLGASYR